MPKANKRGWFGKEAKDKVVTKETKERETKRDKYEILKVIFKQTLFKSNMSYLKCLFEDIFLFYYA